MNFEKINIVEVNSCGVFVWLDSLTFGPEGSTALRLLIVVAIMNWAWVQVIYRHSPTLLY